MRTRKSILNFITSFFPWVIIALIGFPKIHLFISNYGSELNGLTQLIYQIFNYFGLAEMGFGSAIAYKLYKLFAEDNKEKINSVFSGAIKIYRKMGVIIFSLGIFLGVYSIFFLNSAEISKLQIFIIILLNSIDYLLIYLLLMPYQTLLIADQKKYKVNMIVNIKLFLFKIVELLLIVLKVEYILIVIIGIIFNLVSSYLVIKQTLKNYPWIDKKSVPDYSTIGMTKDVFIHKISKIIFNNTDAILLSLFKGGLLTVSIYSSYNYIMTYLRQVLDYVINSPLESFGNLFANSKEKEKKKLYIFNEYLTLSMVISIFFSAMFYISILPFIKIWLGDSYVIDNISIVMFTFILFLECISKPVVAIISACGKFKETKYVTIFSAISNIVLSVLLVKKYQISGVLFATAISELFITIPFYVKCIYNDVLKVNMKEYYKKFVYSLLITVCLVIINKLLISKFSLYVVSNFFDWFVSSLILGIIDFAILFITLFLSMKSFKALILRFKGMVVKNENKYS